MTKIDNTERVKWSQVIEYDTTTGASGTHSWSELATEPAPLPTQAWLRRAGAAVQDNPDRLRQLLRERGLTGDTAAQFGVGWDGLAEAWTLPVYDARGKLVNCVWRPPRGGSMYWKGFRIGRPRRVTGRTAERGELPLWPRVPDRKAWLLVAGEWDCLAAIQAGLPAVTGLCGCRWLDAWNQDAIGRRIAVLYDRGEERAAALTVERLQFTAEAWRVELPRADEAGFDVCDWFQSGRTADELIKLIRRARP